MRLRNMDLPSFLNHIKDKEVLCFGAGKLLNRLCNSANIESHVKAVFDNDKNKRNKKIEYAGQSFNVYSPSDLEKFEISPGKTVILITAGMANAGRALYDEINRIEKLSDLECFFLSFIFAEIGSIERIGKALNFRLTDKPLIPKYIHYCWFGGKEIPKEQQRFIEGWKEKCPDFEIVRWDENNYDVKKNAYMKKAYEEGKWAFVSDYARKDIVYCHGGIYLDVDVEVIKPLHDLLYQKGFFGTQPDFRVASGLGFAGVAGLDIIREMRDVYINEPFFFKDMLGMKVAPDYETNVLIRNGYVANGALQRIAGITVYPLEVLSGSMPYTDTPFITENTYTIHHYAGSWVEKNRKNMNDSAGALYKKIKNFEIENILKLKKVVNQ